MKELRARPTSSGVYMRVLFAFDIRSRAIMLVAGDKSKDWKKWYDKNIPIADELFTMHQERLQKQLRENTAARRLHRTKKGKKR